MRILEIVICVKFIPPKCVYFGKGKISMKIDENSTGVILDKTWCVHVVIVISFVGDAFVTPLTYNKNGVKRLK